MSTKTFYSLLGIAISALLMLSIGCSERTLNEIEPAKAPVNGNIFIDGFSGGLEYAAFGGSDPTAFEVVNEGAYEGTSVMRFSVPDVDNPSGAYAGGAFFVSGGRDLSGFTVLTFWAKASKSATLDIVGFGNDLDQNRYVTTITNTPVNTNWKKYYIPIPDPSKLTEEKGMFFYSEGPENGAGYTFWIDEVRFESLGTIAPREAAAFNGVDSTISLETGASFSSGGFAEFNLPTGINRRVEVAPAYFSYTTSDPMVATVSPDGLITAMDAGQAVITAKLDERDASGSLTVTSTGELVKPTAPAPTPTFLPEDVIAIYSDAYQDEPIDFLNGYWEFSTTQSQELQIQGDDIFRYSQLNFVGIQFTAPTIDISQMTHFHMDIWTPDPTATAEFIVELVDVGPDNSFEGNDGSSGGVTLTSPLLETESWVSIDLPLSDFTSLATRQNLAQIVLSGGLPNVFVDNIYFYDDGTGGGGGGGGGGGLDLPPTPAPTPVQPASDVISIFSDAYVDEPLDFVNGFWEFSTTQSAKVAVQGDSIIQYTQLNFVGIQFTTPTIDVSQMTHLHVDIWTPNPTASAEFKILLRDFGPNDAFDESGDDSFHELSFASPPLQTGSWVSLDLPLSDFAGLTGRSNLAQLVFSGDLPTVFADNIYFYRGDPGGGGSAGGAPSMAAPTPTFAAADVISLFSDAYSDVPVDIFRTEWSMATLTDTSIAGNAAKIYSALDFVGIETANNQIDASGMTHFHIDVWTPNATLFAIKMVDFGPNGVFDGGDDTEHQIDFANPAQGQWISYDIPLTDFVDLTNRANIAQYVLVGQPTGSSKIYVDNIYFRK